MAGGRGFSTYVKLILRLPSLSKYLVNFIWRASRANELKNLEVVLVKDTFLLETCDIKHDRKECLGIWCSMEGVEIL